MCLQPECGIRGVPGLFAGLWHVSVVVQCCTDTAWKIRTAGQGYFFLFNFNIKDESNKVLSSHDTQIDLCQAVPCYVRIEIFRWFYVKCKFILVFEFEVFFYSCSEKNPKIAKLICKSLMCISNPSLKLNCRDTTTFSGYSYFLLFRYWLIGRILINCGQIHPNLRVMPWLEVSSHEVKVLKCQGVSVSWKEDFTGYRCTYRCRLYRILVTSLMIPWRV